MFKLQKLFFAEISEQNIKLNLVYDQTIPEKLSGDPNRIARILYNLINNALKFTKSGGSIDVQVENHSEKDIRISVSDHGKGISPENLDIIFNRFQKIDSTTTDNKGSYGLGLAICKKLVEIMGGSIGVESDLGKGTTFYFNLPLRE
jgi:signal transduction histidine kinase